MQRYGASRTSDGQRPGLRQRLSVLGFTVLVELVVVLLIIAFGGSRVRELIVPTTPTAITFVPNELARPASPQQRRRQEEAAPSPAPPVPTPPTPPVPPTPPIPPTPNVPRAPLPYVPLSRLDLAASDIAKLGSAAAPARAGAGAGAGAGTKTAAGPGEGPGGAHLYNAEWVVEPSNAQLNAYLPRGVERGSWALIACQTIAHNQVENCAQLGEAPRGSGLAKAMRLAAWQFRIRPPRIDGQPMIGAWVRIKIDFGDAAAR